MNEFRACVSISSCAPAYFQLYIGFIVLLCIFSDFQVTKNKKKKFAITTWKQIIAREGERVLNWVLPPYLEDHLPELVSRVAEESPIPTGLKSLTMTGLFKPLWAWGLPAAHWRSLNQRCMWVPMNSLYWHVMWLQKKYRAEKKSWYVVARNVFLLLLNFSAWPCLGPA